MESYLIDKNATIKQALNRLSVCGEKCIIVVNKNKILQGTLSDGDIRKCIINHKSLSNKISGIYNKNPKRFLINNFNESQIEHYFINLRLEVIPIVDKKNKVVDAVLFSKYFNSKEKQKNIKFNKKIDVIVMAGGLGSRLAPYSNIVPKPLLSYKNKTLIEHILSEFYKFNLKEFIISVNYKENIIKAYLRNLNKFYKIKYLSEKKQLGTFGALSKLKNSTEDIFVINCDTIININYIDYYDFHKKNKNDLTIVTCSKEFQMPYGCFNINNKGKMIKMIEKPKNHFLINVGFYLLSAKMLSFIPKDTKFDFNEFLELINKKNKKIGFYTIDEYSWKDLGEITPFNE